MKNKTLCTSSIKDAIKTLSVAGIKITQVYHHPNCRHSHNPSPTHVFFSNSEGEIASWVKHTATLTIFAKVRPIEAAYMSNAIPLKV